jgi:hypothetical protein
LPALLYLFIEQTVFCEHSFASLDKIPTISMRTDHFLVDSFEAMKRTWCFPVIYFTFGFDNHGEGAVE